MIEHYWTVLCSKSMIDADSNNISLLNVIEQFNIVGSPPGDKEVGGIPADATIVSMWGRSNYQKPERGDARYIIEYKKGKLKKETEGHEIAVDLSEHRRYRTRINMPILPAMGEGIHRIQVMIKGNGEDGWRNVSSLPYEVRFAPEAESGST